MKTTYALLLALGLTAVMAIHPSSARAADGSSDVFADEGDTDFDSIPTDVSKVPAAPAMKVQAAAKDDDDAPVAKPAPKHADANADEATPVEHQELHRRNTKHTVKHEDTTVAVDAPAPATDEAAAAVPAERAATAVADQTGHDVNGFRVTGKDCPMYREPASEGDPMITVKSDKRIWVEPKGEWVRAYSKAGPGYISADCLK